MEVNRMKIEQEEKFYRLELSDEEMYVLFMKFELVKDIHHQFTLTEISFKNQLRQFYENYMT